MSQYARWQVLYNTFVCISPYCEGHRHSTTAGDPIVDSTSFCSSWGIAFLIRCKRYRKVQVSILPIVRQLVLKPLDGYATCLPFLRQSERHLRDADWDKYCILYVRLPWPPASLPVLSADSSNTRNSWMQWQLLLHVWATNTHITTVWFAPKLGPTIKVSKREGIASRAHACDECSVSSRQGRGPTCVRASLHNVAFPASS